MNKISNEQNIVNLEKRKKLRIIMVILASLTIAFAVGSLIDIALNNGGNLYLLLALICFLSFALVQKKRNSIQIIKKDELEEVRKEINKNKKKYKK